MSQTLIRDIGTILVALIVVGGGGYLLATQPSNQSILTFVPAMIGVVVTAYFGNHVITSATNGQLTAINSTADKISAAREQAAETTTASIKSVTEATK